jgi:hypothetical protein
MPCFLSSAWKSSLRYWAPRDGGKLFYALAAAEASAGSSEQALAWLSDAIDAGWDDRVRANHDPVLADIISLPAYQALIEGINQQ